MKTLSYLLFFICLTASCQKEKEFPTDSKFIISALSYEDSTKPLPVPIKDYLLRVTLMENPNSHDDQFRAYLFYDTVNTINPIILTPENTQQKGTFTNLVHGRYIISVNKGEQVSVMELIFKGGPVELSLILR